MVGTTSAASGQYIVERTDADDIRIVVFHRRGKDCVGFEGKGAKRKWISDRENEWNEVGFLRHQKSLKSNKRVSTFIQEFNVEEDGKIDPRLRMTYHWINNRFSNEDS